MANFAGKNLPSLSFWLFFFVMERMFAFSCKDTRLTWIHFVELAAGWHRVGRQRSAHDLPSIAPSRQIDQCLTPSSLNSPFQLNFQFLTTFFNFDFEIPQKLVRLSSKFCNFDAKFWVAFSSPEILTDTSMLFFVAALLLLFTLPTFIFLLVFLKPLSRLFSLKLLLGLFFS